MKVIKNTAFLAFVAFIIWFVYAMNQNGATMFWNR